MSRGWSAALILHLNDAEARSQIRQEVVSGVRARLCNQSISMEATSSSAENVRTIVNEVSPQAHKTIPPWKQDP